MHGHQLHRYEGKTISQIRRAFYEHKGRMNPDVGMLELTFTDDRSVVFHAGSNGQELGVRDERWVDPFTEPLSVENREFVATSGKWIAVDVSSEGLFAPLIGEVIVRVRPTFYVFDHVSGVYVETPSRALVGENRFDDFYVTVIDLTDTPSQ